MNTPKLTERTTDKLLAGTAGFSPMSFGPAAVGGVQAAAHSNAQRDPLKPEKVAILGTAPSSRLLAPFGDPSYTIWGSSPGNMGDPGSNPSAFPRLPDAWFEIHSNLLWPEYQSYGIPYVKWLNEKSFPLMAIDKSLFPRAQLFPWRELVREFGPYFFTSTFAWMAAFALHQGAKEIGFFGVDMSSKDEYITQRPGGHYFITLAKQRGIKLNIPNESDLIQPPPLYGIFSSMPMGRKLATRRAEVKGRIAHSQMQISQLQGEMTYLNGALEDIDYWENIWGGHGTPGETSAPA
jgi:hypothetical protein